MKYVNAIVVAILRSPFHGLLSGRLLVITLRGRRTGSMYHIPVEYHQDGNLITIISREGRRWWRNLIGGADVMLRLRGADIHAAGSVIEDEQAVASAVQYAYVLPNDRAVKFAAHTVVLQLRLRAVLTPLKA